MKRILKRAALVLSLTGLFYSIGNAREESPAQEKSEATIGLSYYKKADMSKTAVATIKVKKNRKFSPAPGVKVNFYSLHNKEQQLLQSVSTDNKGEARITLDKSLPLDEDQAFTIIAKIESDPKYEDAQEQMHFREANLSLVLNPKDTGRLVTARVTETGKDGAILPVKGVELKFYVQRLFGNMPAGEEYTVSTDEKGEASFNFPKNIHGDTAGQFNVVARMEDNEKYGNVENKASASWGTVLATIKDPFPRGLWEPYAPMPLVLTISILFGGVWSTYIFIFVYLFKIKKEGGPIASNKQKTQIL